MAWKAEMNASFCSAVRLAGPLSRPPLRRIRAASARLEPEFTALPTIQATVQGFNIGVKVHERVPYSRIELVDYGAPFAFHIVLHFDPAAEDPYKTDFHVMVEADLNLMMKMMLSGKVKEALDKVVDGIVDASNGKMPEGFDPKEWMK